MKYPDSDAGADPQARGAPNPQGRRGPNSQESDCPNPQERGGVDPQATEDGGLRGASLLAALVVIIVLVRYLLC